MEYNKRNYAALLLRLMSSLWPMTNKTEHIINPTMPRILASFILLLTTSLIATCQCTFSSLGDGSSCAEPLPLCSNTIGVLPPQVFVSNFPNLCATGSIENPRWYEFIACESTVTLQIVPGTFTQNGIGDTGMQGSISSDCSPSSSLVCNDDPNDTGFTLSASNFIVGEIYFLVLDGYGASECDFEVNVIEGICEVELNTIDEPSVITSAGIETCNEPSDIISFNASECLAQGDGFVLPTLLSDSLICYQWTFDPDIVDFVSDSTLSSIEVVFTEEGSTTVSVEVFVNPILEACSTGSCGTPDPIDVTVNFLETVINPKTIICPGDQVNICGVPVGIDGVYDCLDEVNCVLTIDTIEFATPDQQDLGVLYLCPGECYELENIEYCDRQQYVITSAVDCGISYEFEIEDVFINIQEPSEYPILDCSGDCAFLNMVITTNYADDLEYCFTDPFGVKVSEETFTDICTPGEYTFTVFSPDFQSTCFETIVFNIETNDAPPLVELSSETLTCTEREAELSFMEIDNIVSFEWTGPGIEDATELTAFATLPGWYYFEGVGDNGCVGLDSIEVLEELIPAEIDIDFENLTCDLAMTTLSIITSDISVDSVIWIGIGDFVSRELQPVVQDTGTYVANIYASNGCDYTEIFKILGFFQEPEFDIAQEEFWFCDTESLLISSTITLGDNVSYQWFTENGDILSDETNSEISVGTTGEYYLQVTDGENGCVNIDTFNVMTDPEVPSEVELFVTNPSCFGLDDGMIEIGNIEGGKEPFTFMIDEMVTTDLLITDLAPDSYDFTLIDDNGCELNRTLDINAPDEIIGEIEGPETAIYNETITISSIYDATAVNVDVVNWYNTIGELLGTGDDLVHVFLMTETFTMELIDINGCSILRDITIRIDEDFDYYTPTVFTPNGDGLNDIYRIFSQNAPGEVQSFIIYDRWGNRVYELDEVKILPGDQDSWGWDGRLNGRNVAAGVYVYHAIVETLGVTKELKGSITLVR